MLKVGLSAVLVSLLSFLLGFARDLGIAAEFGGSLSADIIFVALLVPVLVENVFGIALRDALVPHLQCAKRISANALSAEAARLGRPILLGSVAIALVLALVPEPVLSVLMPGWSAQQIGSAIPAFQIGSLTIVLTVWAYFLSAGLYLRGRFVLPLWRSIGLNVGAIFALAFFDASPALVLFCIAVGLLLHLLWLQFSMGAYGVLPGGQTDLDAAPGGGLTGLNIAGLMALFLPLLAATSATQINVIAERFFASWLEPGTVAQLSYAYRLVTIPLTIFTLAVLAIVFTRLTTHRSAGDMEMWRKEVGIGVSLMLFLMVPSAAFLIGFAEPVVVLLLQRGAFTAADTANTASMARAYAFGLPFLAFTLLMSRIAISAGATRVLLVAALASVIVTLVLDYVLVQIWGGTGLAAAMAMGATVNALMLIFGMRERLAGTNILAPVCLWLAGGLALALILMVWPLNGIAGLITGGIAVAAFAAAFAALDSHLRRALIEQFNQWRQGRDAL